jgi:hypothetical protein
MSVDGLGKKTPKLKASVFFHRQGLVLALSGQKKTHQRSVNRGGPWNGGDGTGSGRTTDPAIVSVTEKCPDQDIKERANQHGPQTNFSIAAFS